MLVSYDTGLCEASQIAGRAEMQPAPLVTFGLQEPGEEWRTVEVPHLLAFFRHPTRYFVQQRLGIFLEEDPGALATREPFTLDPLSRYALRQEVLQRHLDGEPRDCIHTFVRAAGLLPHGQVGIALFEREWPGIVRFAQRLQYVLPTATRRALDVDLCLGAWHVTGRLTEITPQGLVGYRLGRVRPWDYLSIWVRHLILNCLAPDDVQCESRWLGEDKELLLHTVQAPQMYLQALLEWYWHGLHRPLHFFPDSAFAYVEAARQGKPDPRSAARTRWEGTEYQRGECEESYYQMVFRDHDPLDDEFVTAADAVFLPLFAHL
jgi:exodeoxyribonuclease V gamma subunit